jgi:hypothetical protein
LMLPVTGQSPQPGKVKTKVISQTPSQVDVLKRACHFRVVPPPLICRVNGVGVVVTGEVIIFVAEGLSYVLPFHVERS